MVTIAATCTPRKGGEAMPSNMLVTVAAIVVIIAGIIFIAQAL